MKIDIFVIGTGGTGTWVLKNLSLYLNSLLPDKVRLIGSLHMYDGDTVEQKNLRRQTLFDASDIGSNKAVAVSKVLNDNAFTLNSFVWYAHPEYLLPSNIEGFKKGLQETINHKDIPLVISCVDNNACRLLLEETLSSLSDFMLIDTANGESTEGEVFFTSKVKNVRLSAFRSEVVSSMKDEPIKHVDEMSCEELNTVQPQHIFTNMESASRAVFAVANFLETGNFPRGAAFFDTATQNVVFREYALKKKEGGEPNGEGDGRKTRKSAKKAS